jgi:pimeloyl-ACP methyl ester carboxylesterase
MEVTVRSVPVYYEEFGTGIPILMLHGTPVDHRWMAATMEPVFQDRPGWRRIYPDLPGHGKTPGADWITSQDHILEVLSEFIQAVAPDRRFVVAGLSYGGYLARGMVHRLGSMIDGVALWIPQVETDKTKLQTPAHQAVVEDARFLAALTPQTSFLPDMAVVQRVETIEWFRTYGQPTFALTDWPFLDRLGDLSSFSFPVDQLPAPFPGPALIVTGRQDAMVGYKNAWEILDNYPRGTFAVLDRAGHFLDLEQAPLLQTLTGEWLDRVAEYITRTSPGLTGQSASGQE